MEQFYIYLGLGFQHILDWQGYDHILFVMALCATYLLNEWKQVLLLVTAFTIGHSATLALAVLNLVNINSSLIEFLIPVTILFTCIANMVVRHNSQKIPKGIYVLALVFGLVHGLGFSTYLRSLLGNEASIVQPLLAFNIGLEVGQLCIVAATLFLSNFVINTLQIKRQTWVTSLSSFVAGAAFVLLTQKWFL